MRISALNNTPSRSDPLAVRVGLILDKNESEFREGLREYLRENWHIFSAFVYYANQMRSVGKKHYSARAIVERIRWETDLTEKNEQDFKISNQWIPQFSRLYMMLEPKNDGFFRTRGEEAA